MSAILWWPEVYRAFDLSVPVRIGVGVSGVVSGSTDFGLEVPVGVGMSAAATSSGEFDLAVPVSLGMRGPASADLSVPVSIGMAGAEEYSTAMDLSVPVSIGVEGGGLSSGSFGLEVPVNIGMVGSPYFRDDFNRPDSTTSLGGGWIPKAGQMGINSGAAYAVSPGVYCTAMYPDPLNSDDMEVSIALGSGTGEFRQVFAILGANAAGQAAVLWVDANYAEVRTVINWNLGGPTVQGAFPTGVNGIYNRFTLRRVGNRYTVIKNGDAVGEWVDEGNVLPRNEDHRFVGVGGYQSGGNYRSIDLFTAQTI